MNNSDLIVVSISMITGWIISMLFSWFPKLNTWYDAKPKREKKLWMDAVVIISAVIVWVIGCSGILPNFVNISCDTNGFAALVLAIIASMASSQTAYKTMPHPNDNLG